jgi:hypothetical protein
MGEELSEPAARPSGALRALCMVLGVAAVGTGVFGIAFGSLWAATALAWFDSNDFVRHFELAVPFLPIFLIAIGAVLAVRSQR